LRDLNEEMVILKIISKILIFRQFITVVYRSKTTDNIYRHKQLYRHMLVTGFGYLLAIIRPKSCGSTVARNHTNTPLLIKVKLIPLLIKTRERSHFLHKDFKYQNCGDKNNN
jgi:hypothetical protein